jgi:hypothetical protein
MKQLHNRFTDNQVKELLERYVRNEIKSTYIREILGIGKTRFFALLKVYQEDPKVFSIEYHRKTKSRTIHPAIERSILKELSIEKGLIKNKEVPLKSYNYSYIKDRLKQHYHQQVSLWTVIDRAKKHGHYLNKPQRTAHDREVLTHYAGELVQHDASFHLWAPDAKEKWCLITSLDDHSRFLLYAKLLKRESSWAHIAALQSVFLKYGLPFSYYVDCHSIFRFIRGRDEIHYQHHLQTDEVDPQWKQILDDCGVKVIYALSPQAKGKIERPYRWLQDHLVRTCVRNNVMDIRQAHTILSYEVQQYNYHRVHSTTGEVPYCRFQRALKEQKSLFREFKIRQPYQSVKDIFCLKIERTVDAYRKISINNLQIPVNGVSQGEILNLRVYPLNAHVSEIRFWSGNTLVDVQRLKNDDLKSVHF